MSSSRPISGQYQSSPSSSSSISSSSTLQSIDPKKLRALNGLKKKLLVVINLTEEENNNNFLVENSSLPWPVVDINELYTLRWKTKEQLVLKLFQYSVVLKDIYEKLLTLYEKRQVEITNYRKKLVSNPSSSSTTSTLSSKGKRPSRSKENEESITDTTPSPSLSTRPSSSSIRQENTEAEQLYRMNFYTLFYNGLEILEWPPTKEAFSNPLLDLTQDNDMFLKAISFIISAIWNVKSSVGAEKNKIEVEERERSEEERLQRGKLGAETTGGGRKTSSSSNSSPSTSSPFNTPPPPSSSQYIFPPSSPSSPSSSISLNYSESSSSPPPTSSSSYLPPSSAASVTSTRSVSSRAVSQSEDIQQKVIDNLIYQNSILSSKLKRIQLDNLKKKKVEGDVSAIIRSLIVTLEELSSIADVTSSSTSSASSSSDVTSSPPPSTYLKPPKASSSSTSSSSSDSSWKKIEKKLRQIEQNWKEITTISSSSSSFKFDSYDPSSTPASSSSTFHPLISSPPVKDKKKEKERELKTKQGDLLARYFYGDYERTTSGLEDKSSDGGEAGGGNNLKTNINSLVREINRNLFNNSLTSTSTTPPPSSLVSLKLSALKVLQSLQNSFPLNDFNEEDFEEEEEYEEYRGGGRKNIGKKEENEEDKLKNIYRNSSIRKIIDESLLKSENPPNRGNKSFTSFISATPSTSKLSDQALREYMFLLRNFYYLKSILREGKKGEREERVVVSRRR